MTTARASAKTSPSQPLVETNIRGAVHRIAEWSTPYDVVHAFQCAGFTAPSHLAKISRFDDRSLTSTQVFGEFSGTVVDWSNPDTARRGLEALSIIVIRAKSDAEQMSDSYFWTEWTLLQRACALGKVLLDHDGDMRLEEDETPAEPAVVLDTSGLGATTGIDHAVEELNRLIAQSGSPADLATVASTVVEAVGKTILRERGIPTDEYERLYVHELAARVHDVLGLKKGQGLPGGAAVAVLDVVKGLNKIVSSVRDTRNRANKVHGSDTVTEISAEEGQLAVDGCVLWSRYVMDVYRRQKQGELPPF